MPTLKIIPRNLEKLGIILMVLLLVFRPGFVKNFSNNLIGKMLLLGAIVSVAAHNKMYGLLAAFTYVVCVEMSSEGLDGQGDDEDGDNVDEEKDKAAAAEVSTEEKKKAAAPVEKKKKAAAPVEKKKKAALLAELVENAKNIFTKAS